MRSHPPPIFNSRIYFDLLVFSRGVGQCSGNVLEKRRCAYTKMRTHPLGRLPRWIINSVKCPAIFVFLEDWRIEFRTSKALCKNDPFIVGKVVVRNNAV